MRSRREKRGNNEAPCHIDSPSALCVQGPQAQCAHLAVVTGEISQRDGFVLADADFADTRETSIPAPQYPISAGQAESAPEQPLGPYRCNVGTGAEF